MAFPFTKTTWKNNAAPAISATQLNRIEDALENASQAQDPNDAQLTIKVGGSDIGTFSADASTDVDITIPVDDTLFESGIPADAKTTGELIDASFQSFDTKEASGSLVTFDDGLKDAPLESMTAYITAYQDGSGDPSPTNIRPISGYDSVNIYTCDKNFIDVSDTASTTFAGITYTNNGDGTITANGTATTTSNLYLKNFQSKQDLINRGFGALAGKRFTFSGCPEGGGTSTYQLMAARVTNETGILYDSGSGVTFTLKDLNASTSTSSTVYFRISIYNGYTCDNVVFRPMLRLADEDDTFEPSVRTEQNVSFEDAGTIYGGILDVPSGKLTVTNKGVDMGSLSWAYSTGRFRARITDGAAPVSVGIDASCSSYTRIESGTTNNGFYVNNSRYSSTAYAVVFDDRYTDAASFKTAVTGQTLVYQLETPVSYQLSPTRVKTLLNKNNIWVDTGDTELEYRVNFSGTISAINNELDTLQSETDTLITKVSSIENDIEPLYSNTVSDEIVSVNDGAARQVEDLKISFMPVQNLSGFDDVWAPGGGDNIMPPIEDSTINGVTLINNDDQTITLNGTASADARFTVSLNPVKETMSIQFQAFNTVKNEGVRFGGTGIGYCWLGNLDAKQGYIQTGSLSPYQVSELYISVDSGTTVNNLVVKPCVSLGTQYLSGFKPYSNVCPIYGRTETNLYHTPKNFYDTNNAVWVDAYYYNDTGEFTYNVKYHRDDTYYEIDPNTTYEVQENKTGSGNASCNVCLYDSNKTFIRRFMVHSATASVGVFTATFQTTNEEKYFRVSCEATTTDITIEKGTIKDEVYNFTFPSEAGTVYAGTIDTKTGVFTVTYKRVNLGNLSWSTYSAGVHPIFRVNIGNRKYGSGTSVIPFCSYYTWNGNSSLGTITDSMGDKRLGTQFTNGYICVRDDQYNLDIDAFKQAVAGQSFVYELLEPETYQLTPIELEMFRGYNNLYTDDQNSTVSVTYKQDDIINLYNKIAELISG